MKFLKILLIIVLLSMSVIAYGSGSITSGEKTVYLCPPPEEPNTLNEWFYKLTLREKIDVYTYWQGRVYSQKEVENE